MGRCSSLICSGHEHLVFIALQPMVRQTAWKTSSLPEGESLVGHVGYQLLHWQLSSVSEIKAELSDRVSLM